MNQQSHTSQTLDRGLQILEILASAPADMTISEIATTLDVHRTIANRLVTTLLNRHFLSRSLVGRYRLGTRLVCLAATIGGELRTIARPILMALNEETSETVHLVVLTGTDVLFIDAFESPRALRVASRVGRLLPAHATSVGKALLASLSDEELKALYPATRLEKTAPGTITNRSDLFKQVELVRRQGYSTSFEESEAGVGSVGVAIVDRNGAARAALSIAAPSSRLTPELPRLIAAAAQSARQIGEQL
ncbi:IclR family transcriptional regulator [Sphingosinicella soli]|uniref:DNA-binding IclR family transcriptional regulator n=1 Tax=Sphingosinicella soli TaxID=333708 RepID=A0A7W7F787_9SPHN|nr:IclR family transcriptional regulator [Sphingosinicella soli]MBB4633395.1 DNA-binding IclR family transcriptional regulator [Sphingosinicella soli]